MSDTPTPYVLECTAFNDAGECTAQVWVPQPSWTDGLPTVDQANLVGGAFFVAMATVNFLKYLLKPRKGIVE